MNKLMKNNVPSIKMLADFEKFRISKSQLKMIKGGDDIIIEDIIDQ